MSLPAAALSLEAVSHRYGALQALSGLGFEVDAGETVCLLGPSGCGKSTALRLAAGLEPLQTGVIRLAGREVARPGREVPPEARRVGLMFQDFALFPHLTVAGNVGFGLPRGSDRAARVAALLAAVRMEAFAGRHPHLLSGGQQQRVALARALAPGPGLMLLDEPFSGLDARLREEVRAETAALLRQSGTAVLMVTHDAEEAMAMADRILLMRDGAILQAGPPEEVYARPLDAYAARFMGAVDELPATVRDGGADSPLGRVPTDLPEGTEATVLVRPEALAPADTGISARVLESHCLGPFSLVDLDIAGNRLRMRLPGRRRPAAGETLTVSVDAGLVYVFPRTPSSSPAQGAEGRPASAGRGGRP